MGIDRITMLMTDTNNIKEVLLFPAMKPNDAGRGGADGAGQKYKLFVSGGSPCAAQIVSQLANANVEVSTVNMNTAKTDKDLLQKNPSLTFPYLETQDGQVICGESAIATFIARTHLGAKLLGSDPFDEAQVNQWTAWSDCLFDLVQSVEGAIYGS